MNGDVPVPADYDGDLKTDFAVYRPSTGEWFAYKSGGGQHIQEVWGNYGDQPVPADYDGDSKADLAVWRPTTGVWHYKKSTNGSFNQEALGNGTDLPTQASYIKKTGAVVAPHDLAKARLSPRNQTGGPNLYSQNFGWGTGLVGLPGRAGLDAGFGISYNSLVWTKQGNNIVFDADASNVSPGFRFGFPVIEPVYLDSNTGSNAFLMVSPSGARTEFRQIAATNNFETADSSYAQLSVKGSISVNNPPEKLLLTLTTTDGTASTYSWIANAYRCAQIKDRNGNFITIAHDVYGLLRTVTDTLGRVITVNYDAQFYPTTITQTWNSGNGNGAAVTHTYATFNYTVIPVNPSFANTLAVSGPQPGATTNIKVLHYILSATNSFTSFEYNSFGQVKRINNYASDWHLLNYVETNLKNPGTGLDDCPRLTETKSWVENFNQDANGGAQETVVTNSFTPSATYTVPAASGPATKIEVSMVGHPTQNVSRTYVGSSGWNEGLPIATEDLANEGSGQVRKRWTWTNWTQDDTTKTFIVNPRVIESQVGDDVSRRKTQMDYHMQGTTTVANYGLVKEVRLYDGNLGTLLKKSTTDYNLASAYTTRRIIGLPSQTLSYGLNQSNQILELVSKVTYAYDEGNFTDTTLQQAPTGTIAQHDTATYGAAFIAGRGNLTSTTRCDATLSNATTCGGGITSSVKYNITGNVVAAIDPMGRTSKIGYTDVFNDSTSRAATFAYPTTLTDPAGTSLGDPEHSSKIKYRYDIGANVWAQSPAPAGNTVGKTTERIFDTFGRLEREGIVNTDANTGAYTRYEYIWNDVQARTFSTIVDTNNNNIGDTADEVMRESWSDGAGRVRKSRTEHPGSVGGWSGSLVEYDSLGRVKRKSVPTEVVVNASGDFTPAGDDATRGWLWTSQEYDWKDRVVREVNTDGTDRLMSYQGCGCAGGEVVTMQSELVPRDDQPTVNARRTQRVYADALGRNYRSEVLNWTGATQYSPTLSTPYSTTSTTFNGRDQSISVVQEDPSYDYPVEQVTTMTYDGHGRMKTLHRPEFQNSTTVNSYTYFADDQVQTITDGRGVVTTYSYNNRGLVESVNAPPPAGSGIINHGAISFIYDAVGNRQQMTDGIGTVTFSYDQLSRVTNETRQFVGVGTDLQLAPGGLGRFTIAYAYDLNGGLKSITDPYGQITFYSQNKIGQTVAVNGSFFAGGNHNYANSTKYRAWGAVKSIDYGNNAGTTRENYSYNNRLLPESYLLSNITHSVTVIEKQYQYFEDARIKYSKAMNASGEGTMFDRSYRYDHIGRLTDSRTGSEARGGPMPTSEERPYFFQRSYDVWGNATSTTQQYWDAITPPYPQTKTYVNNKVVDFTYDADGRLTVSDYGGFNYMYNTFGFKHRIESPTNYQQHRWPDGNGNMVREQIAGFAESPQCPNGCYAARPAKYFIRSSVLGGDVISEALSDGRKDTTYVYGFGKVIGQQKRTHPPVSTYVTENILWDFVDPTEVSQKSSGSSWTTIGAGADREMDPLGVETGTSAPTPGTSDPGSQPWDYPRHGDVYQGQPVCVVDGFEMSCSLVSRESTIQCPDNDCGPRSTPNGLLYLNVQALQMGIGTTGYGPGFLPTNVSLNGTTFNVSAGTAHFSTDFRVPDLDTINVSGGQSISIATLDEYSEQWFSTMEQYQRSVVQIGENIIQRVVADANPTADQKSKIDEAVNAALAIVGGNNDCAKFFGASAVNALKSIQFQTGKLFQKDDRNTNGVINGTVGIHMTIGSVDSSAISNGYVSVTSATINNSGAFFKKTFVQDFELKYTPNFGDYSSNSLSSRVLQILHELGHIVVQNGARLLPVDGGDATKSKENTDLVKAKCKDQIDALKEKK